MAKNPVLPLFVKALGSPDAVIGVIAAVSPLAGILFSFPVGFLSDRIGRRRLLVFAGVVFLTAPALYLVVTNAWLLLPIRFFHGLATAILGPIASAIICDEYPDTKGEKLGLYSSATLVGRTIAPVAGGALITLLAFLPGVWNFRMVYLACLAAGAVVFILALSFRETTLPKTEIEPLSVRDMGRSLRAILANPHLLGTGLVEMATYFAFGAFESYLPLYLSRSGVPAYQIGLLFAAQVLAIAVSKPLFGKLSDRIDRRIQILSGIAIVGAGIALIGATKDYAVVLAFSILFGLGMSLSTVATNSYVADVASRSKVGSSLGALSSIMDVGHSGGPLVTGFVAGAAGISAGFLLSFAVAAAGAVAFAVLTRRDVIRSE